jgi:putative ABC transport system permease protein
VPVGEVKTMESVVAASASQSRAMMWLFITFAAFALILAASGIYGVVAYSTAQRTFEMGVRVALGATRADLLRLVLGQSLKWVVGGLTAGIVASAGLARMLAGSLFGVATTDPATYFAVAALVAVVALSAGYTPARRASKVDPVTALRVD